MHELGHFLTARLFDVHIEEFSIGMGPKIFSKKSKKTDITYSLRLLPIGGFVAMVGEDDESDDDRSFGAKPVWQRMIISAAGSVMNLLCGFLLSFAMVVSSSALGGTVIAQFDDNAVSQSYGLKVGDEVVSVDGNRVHIARQLVYEISRCTKDPVDIVVIRDGEKITVEDVVFGTETEEGVVFGKSDFYVKRVDKSFGNVMKQTFFTSCLSVKNVWQSIGDLITGRYGVEAVSGPVGVTSTITSVAKQDTNMLLYLCSVIAINLGIFNLLPIPALDGGKIFFQLIELIFRKPVNKKVEGYIHTAGILILFGIIAIVTFKDIWQLIRK